jgi:FkbM family methyltransferase
LAQLVETEPNPERILLPAQRARCRADRHQEIPTNMSNSLKEEVYREVLSNVRNVWHDNHDRFRYGELPARKKLRLWVLEALKRVNFFYLPDHESGMFVEMGRIFAEDIEFLYDRLSDLRSKDLLVRILSYKILGFFRYKLPLSSPEYWRQIDDVRKYRLEDVDFVTTHWGNRKRTYFRYDIRPLGLPLQLYSNEQSILTEFVLKQYEYSNQGLRIGVTEGDTVIEGGACYGDTALHFAALAGERGQVHSFEFVPGNICICKQNIALNPACRRVIQLVERPMWNETDVSMYYAENGPASRVSLEPFAGGTEVRTYTIDDMVRDRKLNRIDFIKMDIEGAELNAICGAAETIRRDKPKLAIALYHSFADFIRLPKKIIELNPHYRLYLGHFTIHREETILYAIDKSNSL